MGVETIFCHKKRDQKIKNKMSLTCGQDKLNSNFLVFIKFIPRTGIDKFKANDQF